MSLRPSDSTATIYPLIRPSSPSRGYQPSAPACSAFFRGPSNRYAPILPCLAKRVTSARQVSAHRGTKVRIGVRFGRGGWMVAHVATVAFLGLEARSVEVQV